MKSHDTLPDPPSSEASRKATKPGIAPRADRDQEVTEPGFRPDSVRGVPELRAVLVDDGLDELAVAAKATLMMPERADSDGARNARYATEGRPARAEQVTIPTGDVLVEPVAEPPPSKPPEEVVGLMRDSIPEPAPHESPSAPEARELPSGKVDMGMAVETSMSSRRDVVTAPSARLVEEREGRSRAAYFLVGIGVTVLLLVIGFGFILREPRAAGTSTVAPAHPDPPAVRPPVPIVGTSLASPRPPVVVSPVGTVPYDTSPATTSPHGLARPPSHPATPLKPAKPEPPGAPLHATPAPPATPATKPSVAPPIPTDITHNID